MKRLFLEKIPAWLLIVIFFGLVLHTPVTVWLSSQWPGVGLFAKSWKEVLLLVVYTMLAVDVTYRHQWHRWLSDRLVWLPLLFAMWHVAVMIIAPQSLLATVVGLMVDLRFVAFFVAIYIFTHNYPYYRKYFLRALLAGVVVVIGFAMLQLILPRDILATIGYSQQTILPYQTVDSNESFVRINSTLRGPNPLGAYASVVVVSIIVYAVVYWRALSRKQQCGIVGCLVAVMLTLVQSYSRSAWLATGVGVAVIIMTISRARYNFFIRSSRKLWAVIGVLVVSVLCMVLLFQTNTFKTVIFHDDVEHGPIQTSDSDRIISLQNGLRRVVEQPFGAGVGSTGSASVRDGHPMIIENQYLFVAHEVGIIGLLIFVALTASVLVKLWCRQSDWLSIAIFASGTGLSVIGLFLPVFVDDVVSMLWWGLAGLVITENIDDKPNAKTA